MTTRRRFLTRAALGGLACRAAATASPSPLVQGDPASIADAVAFWNFQEPAGSPRVSLLPPRHALIEGNGPVKRAQGGVFGPYAAHIHEGQWLAVPRSALGALNIHGPRAQVTVVAWIRRETSKQWQAIGGVWDESRKKRQYYLFTNAAGKWNYRERVRYPAHDNVQGHISAVGGPTEGFQVCITYASGKTPLPMGQWQMIAMSYDGEWIRTYVNGELDSQDGFNPSYYPDGIFDGGADGADFTVGSNSVQGKMHNHFAGQIGGLAVYSRALSAGELRSLAVSG